MNAYVNLPPIIIGTHDYDRLTNAAQIARQQGKLYDAAFLIAQLQRAAIADPDDIPEGVVSTKSRVTYRLNDDPETVTRVLVHAGDMTWPSAELCVMTPLGTALLGLRVGDRMPFYTSGGQQHEVLVEDVGSSPGGRCALQSPHELLNAGRRRLVFRNGNARRELQREPGP